MNYFHEKRQYPSDIEIQADEVNCLNFPAHWHDDIEIVMVTSGSLEVGFNFQTYHLTAGEMLLISGGNIHYYKTNGESHGLLLLFSPKLLTKRDDAFSVSLIIKGDKTKFFADIYNSLKSELENRDIAYKSFITSYLGLLASWLMRNLTSVSIIGRETASIKEAQRLFEYIEENYRKNISIDMGAGILNFSKWYFCRYFKSLTGTSFSKYVNIVRVQAGKNMLITSNNKVTQIAHDCGFETVRTFNREFKSLTGMTPKEYRQAAL